MYNNSKMKPMHSTTKMGNPYQLKMDLGAINSRNLSGGYNGKSSKGMASNMRPKNSMGSGGY